MSCSGNSGNGERLPSMPAIGRRIVLRGSTMSCCEQGSSMLGTVATSVATDGAGDAEEGEGNDVIYVL